MQFDVDFIGESVGEIVLISVYELCPFIRKGLGLP